MDTSLIAPRVQFVSFAGEQLRIALGIYLFGMVIVPIYLARVYRIWRGKVGAY